MSTSLRHSSFLFLTILIVGLSASNGFAQDRFWVNGSGSWNDPNHWAEVSGGKSGASVPSETNNVVFDEHSFTASQQQVLIQDAVECADFRWEVTKYNPTLKSKSFIFKTFTKSALNVNGSVHINKNVDNEFYGDIILKGSGQQKLESKAELNSDVIIDADEGEYQLKNDLITNGNIIHNSGHLNFNEYNTESEAFISAGNNARRIDFGDSKVISNKVDFSNTKNLQFTGTAVNIEVKDKYNRKSFELGGLPVSLKKAGAKAGLDFEQVLTNDALCNGDTGSIFISISGGVADYTYTLYDYNSPPIRVFITDITKSDTTHRFTGLFAGDYVVRVEDSGVGLKQDGPYTVAEPEVLSADSIGVNAGLTCWNGSDAEFEAYASGGNAPYSYQWVRYNSGTSGWDTLTTMDPGNKILTGASQGWYKVLITGALGCDGIKDTEIYFLEGFGYDAYIPDSIDITGVSSTNTCVGFNTGSITISATGGTTPLNYAIVRTSDSDSTLDASGVFSNLQADTYKVYAIDANDCFKRASDVTITSLTNPTVSILPADRPIPACPGVALALDGNPTVYGGATIASHLWSGVDSDSLDNKNIQNPNFTSDVVGSYNVTYTVTDNFGCTGSESVTIDVDDTEAPTISCIADPSRNTDAGQCYYTVVGTEFDPVTVTDNCGISSVTNDFNGLSTLAGEQIPDGTFITWTATDNNANTAQCNFTVTVTDNEDPTISCIANPTRNVDAGQCYYTVVGAEFDPTSTGDNCGIASVTNDFNGLGTLAGEQITDGTTITWTITDNSGNTAQCSFTATVVDNEDPTISCIADPTRNVDAGECYYTVVGAEFDPTGTGDNCGIASVTNDFNGLATLAGAQITDGTSITWTITDNSGNTDQCSFTVTVVDNENPTISCIPDPTRNVDAGQCYYTVVGIEFDPTSVDDNCGYTLTNNINGTTTLDGEQIIDGTNVIWTATDSEGNTAQCSFTVTVVDNEDPTISCIADPARNPDAGECYYTVVGAEFDPTSTGDNCGIASITNDFNGLSTLNGEQITDGTTITWTITDNSGNTALCSFTVTVVDNEDPTISCIADPTRNVDPGQCYYTVVGAEFDPTSTGDNCGIASVTNDFNGLSTLAGEQITDGTSITWTITDNSGNTAQCIFTVTVIDNENPTISCIADPTRNVDAGQCYYTVVGTEFDPTSVNDNCSYTLTNNINGTATLAGEQIADGTAVIWTVTDGEGNTAQCSFTVTVVDNEDPTISCIADPTRNPDAGQCYYTVSGSEFDPTSTGDNCGIVSVTNDFNGLSTLDGEQITDATTITWTVTDNDGNTAQCSYTVTVTDNEDPTISCIADPTRNVDPGQCYYTVVGAEFDPTSTGDNCGIASVTNDFNGLGTLAGEQITDGTTITWTITDNSGNTAQCSFTVNVIDNEDPTISCIADPTRNVDAGECYYTVVGAEFDPTSTGDNCGIASVTNDFNGLATLAGEQITDGINITWTITDNSGNTAQCSFTATVVDNENPTISCIADPTRNTDAGQCYYTVVGTEFDPTSVDDNCSYTLTNNINGTSTLAGEQITDGTPVTWTVTDGEGNTTQCSYTVTVVDNEDPTITCPADQSVMQDGSCSSVVNSLTPTTNDNCGVVLQTWTISGATVNASPGAGINDVSGETFNIGVTTVTYHVEDAAGNFVECSFDVEIYDEVDGGLIDADQTICYNTIPDPFTDEASASVCGGFTYQWQMKSGTGVWTDIPGAINATYAESNPLTQITYYNRKAISDLGFGTAYSDTITITIQPAPVAYAGQDTTLCYGTPYQISDSDTTYSDGVTWEILTGNGTLDDVNIINPEYTPDASDGGTTVELVLHASGLATCADATDTIRITYPAQLLASIGKPTPYFIDSTSTHINVYFKIEGHRHIFDLGLYLVSPLDSVVELKEYCVGLPPPPTQDITARFYNDPYDTSSVYTGTISSCSPTNGYYRFIGDWKKKLHGQDPANGSWRVRVGDNRSISGADGFLREATITFLDTTQSGVYETILYADSAINKPINESPGGGVEVYTDHSLPLTGLMTSCFGVCDAAAVVTATGGTSPYKYAWSSSLDFSLPISTKDTAYLCAGTYYVQVMDSLDCIAIDSVTVGSPPEIYITEDTVVNNICYGDTLGKVMLKFAGGTGALQYGYNGTDWYNSGDTIFNLAADTLTFTIRDISGCTKDTVIIISEPTPINITTNVTDITCYGADDGEIEIIASGGTPAVLSPEYNYSIDSASTWFPGNLFSSLSPDTFYIAVRDSLGCIQFGDTIEMLYPDSITIDSINIKHVICDGSAVDGEIVVHATGGTGDLDYSINNGTDYYPDSLFTGLPGGDYQISVRDERGCEKVLDTLITINGPIIITNDTVVHNSCNNYAEGKVALEFSGGTGILQYSYNGTDWYNSGDTIFNLGADTLTFTIQGATGCSKDTVITINEPAPINIATNVTDITCYGDDNGEIEIIASGGTPSVISPDYNYSIDSAATWFPGNLFGSLAQDTFYIAVRDSLGCIQFGDTIEMLYPDTISIDAVEVIPTTCSGSGDDGQIVVTTSGGVGSIGISTDGVNFQYGNDTIKGLPVGDTTVYVRDDCGIKMLDSLVSITGPEPVVIDSVVVTSPIGCNGGGDGEITVYASGGNRDFTYYIDGVSNSPAKDSVFTGLSVGPYTFRVERGDGCISPDSTKVIGEPTPVTISSLTVIHTSECNDPEDVGVITVFGGGGTPGYEYAITGEPFQKDNSFNNLAAGNYTITVRDTNLCEFTLDTAIVLEPAMSIDLTKNDITCNGVTDGSVSITVNNGDTPYSYSWSNGSTASTITGLGAGIYTVTVTDSNLPDNCIDSASIEITEPAAMSVVINSKDVYCINSDARDAEQAKGYINPGVTGGSPDFTYYWEGPDGFTSNSDFITGLDAGTYFLTVTDSRGCQSTDDETILESTSYDITSLQVTFQDSSICWNDSLVFSAEFNGSSDSLIWQITNLETEISSKVEYSILGSSPYNGSYKVEAQTYFDIITLQNDYCQTKSFVRDTIDFIPSFRLDIVDEQDGNAQDDTVYLKGARTGLLTAYVIDPTNLSFEWYESGELISGGNQQTLALEPDSSAYYTVIVTSDSECADTSQVYLEFIPAISPNEAFTPNGDDKNDKWIINFIDKFPNNTVKIFNRWGLLVYEQNGYYLNKDESRTWDGRAKNGKELPSGTYYYVIILNEEGFSPITGPITIIR